MEELILNLLRENPLLSASEIGKRLGKSRTGIQYWLNKLNIHRDRRELQLANNSSREKVLTITENAEQILLGSILGDGYMSPNRHPENTKLTLNSELRIQHGIRQEEYIKYKKQLLENEGIKCYLSFLSGDKKKTHFIKGREVIENGTFRLKTQRNVSFNFYRNLFYKKHKIITRYFYKLNALGLAIWYMDDGYYKGSGCVLCTNSFSFKEVELLQNILKHNFDLNTTIQKSNLQQPLIYIKSDSKDKFINLIKPYICESMFYKIGI